MLRVGTKFRELKIDFYRFARRVQTASLLRAKHSSNIYFPVLSWIAAFTLLAGPVPVLAGAGGDENIAIALSSHVVESPVGYGDSVRVVPGSVVDFSLSVTGPTEGGSTATSFAIVDAVPEHLALFVGDLTQSGTGPAMFKDHDSGLEFSFGGLADPADSIEFSRDGGKTFDYVPVADIDGFDHNVTHIRLRPSGALLPTNGMHERFSLRYRMKVK